MLDITQLTNPDYILDNFIEVQELNRLLDKHIKQITERVKTFWEIELDEYTIWYSEKVKYIPVDINKILELYPIWIYPIYNITLNSDAKDIIKTEWLLQRQSQKVLKVIPKVW